MKRRTPQINDLEQNIFELQYFGYTILQNQVPDHAKYLKLIQEISASQNSSNKSLHDERINDSLVYNLQNKHIDFIKLLSNTGVQSLLKHFLNDEYYQVQDSSLPNFILSYYNARSSGKFLDLHIDSMVPAAGEFTWAMQAAFVLEDMDEKNGCTVVIPGSHLTGKYTNRQLNKRVPIIAKAGDVAIWDSRLWHGTLDNISGNSRWVLIATFTRWWIKQTMNMTVRLPEEIYGGLTNEEKSMLGFCSIPPVDEYGSIHTKKSHAELKKFVRDYQLP